MTGRGQAGGAGVQVLGGALLILLLVGMLGLAETARAATVKARATRALAAALQSAARTDLADPESARQTFTAILTANLRGIPHHADFLILPGGGIDPITGRHLGRAAVSARLKVPHRLEYLANWLPAVTLELTHAEPAHKRKPPA